MTERTENGQEADSKPLTQKQRAFVEHYLTCWNAAEAARKAGYSERSARSIGSENLTKPNIQAYVRARLKELKMQADEVLLSLADHARGSLADFVEIDEGGRINWNFTKAAAANKLKLVKKFKITRREGQNYMEVTEELELYDAQSALVHLGKHHRLFPDKIEIEGGASIEQFNEAMRALAAAQIDPAATLNALIAQAHEEAQRRAQAHAGDAGGGGDSGG